MGKTVVELDSFLFSVEWRTRERVKGSGHLEEAREPQQLCSPDHPETKCFHPCWECRNWPTVGFHRQLLPFKGKRNETLLLISLSFFQLVLTHVYFEPRSCLWSHGPGFEICSSIPHLTLDKLQLLGKEELLDCCVHYIKRA